jgi:hypothetical protein
MVFACALDGTGNELGRIELDAKSQDSPRLAAEFIRQHAAEPADAQKKWDEAFSTAKQTGRKVWARTSQRYCGPCFKLTRWLDDHKEVLDQDYVFLKVDDWRDLHGGEVAHRLTDGQNFGIPFFAIFDADGRRLITSESPIGNTGFPDGFDETRHMRKMLTETRGKITTEQIDRLIDSLND